MRVKKVLIVTAFVLAALAVIGAVNQFFVLRKAHSSFDNYYAFRGCVELLSKTSSHGICKTSSGEVIKIVEYRGRWYLNNDLPPCFFGSCL